jgi:hypothetical protein
VVGHWESAHVPGNCGIALLEYENGRFHPPQIIEADY